MNDKEEMEDMVCRDFLRNVCRRGVRCKYIHPDEPSDKRGNQMSEPPVFCHDFQNNGCTRPSCKYTHCTREEEEFYGVSGQLPERMRKAGGSASTSDDIANDIPVCKDYLRGDCARPNCKYRHVSNSRDQKMRPSASYKQAIDRPRLFPLVNGRSLDAFEYDDTYGDFEQSRSKRRRMDMSDAWRYQLLDEENIILRHKIETLKQQVSDLKATNEVLLEQNARFRLQKANEITLPAALNHLTTISTAATGGSVNHLALNNDLAAAAATQRAALHMATGATVGMKPVSMENIPGLVAYPRHSASSMAL